MTHLTLAVMGPFEAKLDSRQPEGLNSVYRRALLAYLAVGSRREYTREALAALLWPDRPAQEGLSSLRYLLSNLHATLNDRAASNPFLLVTRTSVQFNHASDYSLDVTEFQALARLPDVTSLERAASLYRGSFLQDVSIIDSPAFYDWQLLCEERVRRDVLSMLGKLCALQIAREDYSEAANWARRQLELEPYREQAHRQLMTALALSGERTAALGHYESCRRLLLNELGCEPEDETQALYVRIRDGTYTKPHAGPVDLQDIPTPPPPSAQTAARFVARSQELAHLSRMLERALSGQGGIALVSGEAGCGKTALMDEFANQSVQAHHDLIVLYGQCSAHSGAGDPYLPFREMLQRVAGDTEARYPGDILSTQQVQRTWEALPIVGAALAEHGPDLINSFVPGEALLKRIETFLATTGMSRWQARLRDLLRRNHEEQSHDPKHTTSETNWGPTPLANLFDQVTRVLCAIAQSRPLLLLIDDLQWADRGTTAMLFHLRRHLAGNRILLACAFRPEARVVVDSTAAPLTADTAPDIATVLQEFVRERGDIEIDLDKADGRAFVEAYIDSEPNRLASDFRQALYDHTGGNPLFTIELLRSFMRDGSLTHDQDGCWIISSGPVWERWPPQVEAVIAGHMAGLPDDDRLLLQVASVQGEQFIAEVVARVLDWHDETVIRRLSGVLRTRNRLVEAVSVERLANSRQRLSTYRFRHLLLQRSAYGSLDAVQRTWLHEATARVLEAIYASEGKLPQALAPELARHFEAADLPMDAARYHLEAGRWVVKLVAFDEALDHLRRGLTLLESIEPSLERLRLELALQVESVNPAILVGGWQGLALRQALERLYELSRLPELVDDPLRLTALGLVAMTVTWSAEPNRGRQVGERLLSLAQENDRRRRTLAYLTLGHSAWLEGHLIESCEHLSKALALSSAAPDTPSVRAIFVEPNVMGLAALGSVQWLVGYADQARSNLEQAISRAHTLGHTPTIAFAHIVAGMTYNEEGRDAATARKHAAVVRSLGQVSQFYRGFTELMTTQGAAHASKSPAASEVESETAGAGVGEASLLLIQALAHAQAGQPELGLGHVGMALDWIRNTGVEMMHAEVLRVQGELYLQLASGAPTDAAASELRGKAEISFQQALEIARGQQAHLLELRAAMSMVRLWSSQNRYAEARELLASVYGWFTEGFDTLDLVEARTMLNELS